MRVLPVVLVFAFLGIAQGQFFQNLLEMYRPNEEIISALQRVASGDTRDLSKLAEKLDGLLGKPKPKPAKEPEKIETTIEKPVIIEKPVYYPVYVPQPQQAPMHMPPPMPYHHQMPPC